VAPKKRTDVIPQDRTAPPWANVARDEVEEVIEEDSSSSSQRTRVRPRRGLVFVLAEDSTSSSQRTLGRPLRGLYVVLSEEAPDEICSKLNPRA
jgi:hypothetical protein